MKLTTQQTKDLNTDKNKYNLKDFPESRYLKLSESWFTECFKLSNLPLKIRVAVKRICSAYNIKGICDPAYIGNLLKAEGLK